MGNTGTFVLGITALEQTAVDQNFGQISLPTIVTG